MVQPHSVITFFRKKAYPQHTLGYRAVDTFYPIRANTQRTIPVVGGILHNPVIQPPLIVH